MAAPTLSRRYPRSSLLIWTAIICAVSGASHASDCKVVLDGILRTFSTPHHSFSTTTEAGTKPTLHEMIYDGKNIYILMSGKWALSPLTLQQLIDQEKENMRNNKTVCAAGREETIDGISATLYAFREESDGTTTDAQIWISKASGLVVHMKESDGSSDTRYVFDNVSTPATH